MARATDTMLARYTNEIEERQNFIDGLVQAATEKGEDLDDGQLELVTRARDRIEEINKRMGPLEEARRISGESSERIAQLAKYMAQQEGEPPKTPEYRSAGEYVIDRWKAGLGQQEAMQRLDMYHRAASHQTTANTAGLLPTPIVEPVVSFIDANRPLVSFLGPRQLPGQNWSRPKVTVHTNVAQQTAEKAELVSQAMTITKLTATAVTLGGYVNVSRQSVDFTQPGIMDIVINDLAGQYAIQTESAAVTAFNTAATAGTGLPTGANTPDQVATALWAAMGSIYGATKGQGRVAAFVSPAYLGSLGPLFPPVPAIPSQSPGGFNAADLGSGLVGQISGVPIYVSPAMPNNEILVVNSAAAEVYEDRIGSLQVVEPSVLGIQVAYAGYFTPLVIEAGSIIKITKTP